MEVPTFGMQRQLKYICHLTWHFNFAAHNDNTVSDKFSGCAHHFVLYFSFFINASICQWIDVKKKNQLVLALVLVIDRVVVNKH